MTSSENILRLSWVNFLQLRKKTSLFLLLHGEFVNFKAASPRHCAFWHLKLHFLSRHDFLHFFFLLEKWASDVLRLQLCILLLAQCICSLAIAALLLLLFCEIDWLPLFFTANVAYWSLFLMIKFEREVHVGYWFFERLFLPLFILWQNGDLTSFGVCDPSLIAEYRGGHKIIV